MDKKRHLIATMFLLLFCVIQLAELHVIDHAHDHSECSLCVLTIDQIQDDYFITAPIIHISEQFETPIRLVQINNPHYYIDPYFGYSPPNKAPPVFS